MAGETGSSDLLIEFNLHVYLHESVDIFSGAPQEWSDTYSSWYLLHRRLSVSALSAGMPRTGCKATAMALVFKRVP